MSYLASEDVNPCALGKYKKDGCGRLDFILSKLRDGLQRRGMIGAKT